MDRIYLIIGQRVRRERGTRGLSQEQLARSVGLSRTSMTNIEAGRQRISVHVLYSIARALAVEPRDLLPLLDELSPSTPLGELEDVDPRQRDWLRAVLSDGESEE